MDGTRSVPATETRILGPAPCPFARLKGKYRFQIQVQGPDGEELFTVEGAGASVATALLLVSALPSRDRLILMAEFIARGL